MLLQAHVVAVIMYQQQQQLSLDINAAQQASVLATALASTVWQVWYAFTACCLLAKRVRAVDNDQAPGAGQYVFVPFP